MHPLADGHYFHHSFLGDVCVKARVVVKVGSGQVEG